MIARSVQQALLRSSGASATTSKAIATTSAGFTTLAGSHSTTMTQPTKTAKRSQQSLPSSRRGYASPSKPNQLATPVEVGTPSARAGRGSMERKMATNGGHRDLIGEVLEAAPKHSDAKRPIYLDAQATTPVDPRVLDAMMPFYTNQYGNPHSRTHAYGWESEAAVEEAREHIANLVGADAKEIIFTSGATESNNLALKGAAHFYGSKKNHIITTQTEHKCVLDSCRKLQDEGFHVTYLPVKENGLIDLKELEDALRPETAVVSIMTVNNEIGVIQPIEEIGQLLKTKGAELAKSKGLSGKPLLHTDAAQAAGKIPLDVNKLNIDLMSLSSHKIYGPKGMGAIYVRRRPRVRLEPIINGGGQERGLRSGTLAPPLIVGFGEAARLAKQEIAYDDAHISALAKRLQDKILSQVDEVIINGDPDHKYAGCQNFSFQYVEGESLLMALKDVCLSSGSACTSASLEPSYVLRALGLADENAHSSLRFGIGRFTTEEEIDYVAEKIVAVVNKLREMSPLWELHQEGVDLSTIQWSG